MRFVIFLGWVGVATALFDAIIWEAESWYKVYLMERLLYPDDKDMWKICKRCKLVDRTLRNDIPFTRQIAALGLPPDTVTIAEFIKGIGTDSSFKNFGRRGGASVDTFRTMDYKMTDLLDEMRYQRRVRNNGNFRFEASYILDHPEFPQDRIGAKFELATMQELVSARGEELRIVAGKTGGRVALQVEQWIRDRAGALAVDNMYRRSDQAVWKSDWIDKNLKYGPSHPYKQIIGSPGLVIFPDGTRPQPDPNNPNSVYKNLENWEEIDVDKTIAQGGQSSDAQAYRKQARKAVASYAKGDGAVVDAETQKAVTEHAKIIRANLALIPFHMGPKGKFFECLHNNLKRRAVPASSSINELLVY